MNTYIDSYCERINPGLFAEPLNAFTNIAFFIAAFLAYTLARRENALDWKSGSLIALMVVIGIGSSLFHTFATLWASLSDTLPILFYQITFLVLYAQNVMKMKCRYSIALLGAFLLTIYGFGILPQDWFNGSLGYAPALLFILGLGLWHIRNAPHEKPILFIAAGVFMLSLTFRSLDMRFCEALPFGLHFLWHCLNGCVLYLTTRAYIRNRGA